MRSQIWRWLLVVFLFGASCWFANLTLYNWWAAGGPPTPHPEVYARRGNLFLFVTCCLFLAAVLLAWINLRARRRLRGSMLPSQLSSK